MNRRYDQLNQSPTRTSISEASYSRQHSSSAPPYPTFEVNEVKQEDQVHSANLNITQMWPQQLSTSNLESFSSMSSESTIVAPSIPHARSASADHGVTDFFAPASRRQSRMTTSTDQTTGSIRQYLPEKTEVYIQQIKRIVKRFTLRPERRITMSPISEISIGGQTWVEDVDAPPSYHTRPFPLPGDFLSVDKYIQEPCFRQTEEHSRRWCMCFAEPYLQDSHWVTPGGYTMATAQVFGQTTGSFRIDVTDIFGNTLLHMVAARSPIHLCAILQQHNACNPLLYSKNTCGQTFLHLIDFNGHSFDVGAFCQLLDFLQYHDHIDCQFLLSQRDCYGRTMFHMLLAAEVPRNVTDFILQRYSQYIRSTRDAFGLLPNRGRDSDMGFDSPNFQSPCSNNPFDRHAALLRCVNQSLENPTMEDFEGKNGLHCLALASLHETNIVGDPIRVAVNGQRNNRSQEKQDDVSDCSTGRLTLRRNLVQNLLDAGVDPNHYDSQGNTPLMAFAAQLPEDGDYKIGGDIIDLLIANGAQVGDRNRAGETALQIAVRCGRKHAIKNLVDQNANVHVRDAAGRSLLDIVDIKVKSARDNGSKQVSRYEACRAHLTSKRGGAIQDPSVVDEWGRRQ